MIVVDSSVWIAWFRGLTTPETAKLRALIPSQVIVGDIVLMEILRGARDDRHAMAIERALGQFHIERMLDERIAVGAATNYRRLRSLGITVRKSVDMIIGTFSIERGHTILHNDRDFLPMVQHLGLKSA